MGIFLSNDGTRHDHIKYIASKAWQKIYIMRKLKFLLDRDSLSRIYISFICPALDYADIVWDNCTQYEINSVKKIQLEAARIAAGATRLVSVEFLYKETGWEPLQNRRYKHEMCQFYKMINDLTPYYLTSLVHSTVENTSACQNIRPLLTRTQLHYKSILPACVRKWNELPFDIRNSASLSSFKQQRDKENTKVPGYYSSGNRLLQIHHTRLRTKCSYGSLNQHLYFKNIIEDPSCICGSVESTRHFLLECTCYNKA